MFSEMCTFMKLFLSKTGQVKCTGTLSTLEDLDVSACLFLKSNKFSSDSEHSFTELILNKITPEYVDLAKISKVDICEDHKKSMTVLHKSVRQKGCAVSLCKLMGEPNRRCTFETSLNIFVSTAEHVPAGSALCSSHRKQFATKKKEISLDTVECSGDLCADSPDKSNPSLDQVSMDLLHQSLMSASQEISKPETQIPLPDSQGLKRKSFIQAASRLPKIHKSNSDSIFSANSQPLEPESQPESDSQTSNYSNSSEVVLEKKTSDFINLMSFLKDINPIKCPNISNPLNLEVKKRTLREYATIVGQIWKIVLETVTIKTNSDNLIETANFVSMIVDSFDSSKSESEQDQISLAMNVLDSIQAYYAIASSDSSRSVTATRKQILQSLTGETVRSSNQLNLLSETIGARRSTVENEAKSRQILDERQKIIPYMKLLARKLPGGGRYVTTEENFDVVSFYESDLVSDLLKGHNNVIKELITNEAGEKFVFQRPKRVLKVHLCELLTLAQKEIGYKHSLSTLIKLRPKWVLLSRNAHFLTCLCDRCQNVQLILRSLSNFVSKQRLHGTLADKVFLMSFDISSSISDFLSKVLHPKLEGKEWNQPNCYSQTCQKSEDSLCGSQKLWNYFQPLLRNFGDTEVQLFQHLNVSYNKPDGSKGSKLEQVETETSIRTIVELLDQRVFQKYHQQPYIMHRLKMLLGKSSKCIK